jgi:serine/threonine-protein kinase RsbW
VKELVKVESYRKDGIKFTPTRSEHQLIEELMSLFKKYDNEGCRFFALDLVNVTRLSDDLLVLILELTARLRRKGGEFYIYNLHYNLLEDILTFNPKSYLAIVDENAMAASESAHIGNKAAESSKHSDMDANLEPAEKINAIEIPYDENDIYKACDFVTTRAQVMGFTENELSRIKIAVYEACLNAIQHTRKMNPGDKVIVEVESRARKLLINVYDRGLGFEPAKAHDYEVTDAALHRKTGGMGLHIIRRAMDEVDYQMDALNGNKLIMVKHLKN